MRAVGKESALLVGGLLLLLHLNIINNTVFRTLLRTSNINITAFVVRPKAYTESITKLLIFKKKILYHHLYSCSVQKSCIPSLCRTYTHVRFVL